jgi:hypothetical protein
MRDSHPDSSQYFPSSTPRKALGKTLVPGAHGEELRSNSTGDLSDIAIA